MLRIRTGPPVTGRNFFNRERELAQMPEYLDRGNVLMLAPRRVGKTSLILRVGEMAPDLGFEAAYLTAAKAQDESGFLRQLIEAVGKGRLGAKAVEALKESPVGRLLRRIEKVEVAGTGVGFRPDSPPAWEEVGEGLLAELEKVEDRRWLLMVDELPVFVLELLRQGGGQERARRFLNWFRALRQRTDVSERVRWILAGSIGLDTVTARLNLGDTINDLHLVHLGPFERETADRFLLELASSYERALGPEVRSHILDRIGWLIPFHVQIAFAEVIDLVPVSDGELTLEDVDRVFEILLSPAKKGYFDYWRQRLDDELGKPESEHARSLLSAVASDDSGASRDTLAEVLRQQLGEAGEADEQLRFLLDVLEGDGYLVEQDGRYIFRSPLLRAFWRRRVMA